MKYWLLTWNPNRWAWDELHGGFDDMKNRIKQVGKVYDTWSTGVNVSIKEGDRVFLIRLGKEPRGIVASGYAVTKVFISPHWDKEKALSGEKSKSIYVEFDKIVDIEESPLRMSVLKEISPKFCWSSQASGISIPKEIAFELERLCV